MTANGYPSLMTVRDADAVQPKDQQRKRLNGRNGQNGAHANGKEHRKDSHRRGGKDRSHDRGGKASNKGHKAGAKFGNPASKPGAPVAAAGLDVQLDPKSLLGISGDLSMASTATSATDASGHLRDICMAHVITSLADKTIGNPALMLQRLLDFSPADYDDLLLALAESGCSYVDILAAYIHNLRVVAADQPPNQRGTSAAASAASASSSPDAALAGGITEKFNELLSEITKASTSAGGSGPSHSRRASGGSGTGAGANAGAGKGGNGRQQQQQQGNRAATPDRRRNGERRERGHRAASPAPPAANGNGAAPQQHKAEQHHGPARGAAGRPPHPPLPPHPPQHQARQYGGERADAHLPQLQQNGSMAELQSHLSGEQQQHSSGELLQQQQQVPVSVAQQQRQQFVGDMISPRTSAAPPAGPPATLQQQQQLYLASLTATANAAMHDLHAGLLHSGMVADHPPPLAATSAAPPQAPPPAKLRTYWSENLEDASARALAPSRADSLQPHASHQLQTHHSQSHHLQSHHSQSHHLQTHHSSHHLQSHESYGPPPPQQPQHDGYGPQYQAQQHLGGGSLTHAPVPEEGPAPPPAAEDAFRSSATAQYMAELQAAALHLMPVQQHQQQHPQAQHQQQVVLLPNGMPLTLPTGAPNGSQGPDMSVLQLSGDPYGTAALGLSQMSSMLSVGSSHAVQLPSFHSEPLQWSTIWQ